MKKITMDDLIAQERRFRGTGRTYFAFMRVVRSDSKVVVFVCPNYDIAKRMLKDFCYFLVKMGIHPLFELHPLTVSWKDRKVYMASVIDPFTRTRFEGTDEVDIIWDHTVFEDPFISVRVLHTMGELIALSEAKRRK